MADIEITTSGGRSNRGAPWRAGIVVGVVAALVLVAFLAVLSTPASASTARGVSPVVRFAAIPSPTAVAATSHELVALSGASCSTVYSVATNGSVSILATLVTSLTSCAESAIAISPGLGNFATGEVFVLLAGELFEVPAAGSSAPIAAALTLANLTRGNMGLAFDATGTFGYTLLAVGGSHGFVDEIDAASEVRSLGSFGVNVEGPAVAPTGFGTVGGELVVAQSFGSSVLAMDPTGSVRPFASYGSPAEGISFVPTIACSFSTTGDAYFVADTSNNSLLAVPASTFGKVAGSGLILGEARGAGVGLLLTNGSTSRLLKISGNLEGASYVTCPAGIAKTVDLRAHGFNGTSLNIIGYDPATQELVGSDPTTAPSQIFLLNGTTTAFVQNVSTGLDPVAVAYNAQDDTLFVANTGSNNLTVLNATTFQELGSVSTGMNSSPVGVAYNPGNQKLYVADSGNDSVVVFSLANNVFPNQNQVLRLPGSPLGLVVNPRDGNVYVVGNASGTGTVWEIHAFKVVHTLSVGTDARSIAVNNGTGTVYVTVFGSNELAFVAPGDTLTTDVALPGPIGVAFDSQRGLVFVDRADGNLSVLQGTTIIANYPFGADPGPLVYDPASDLVYGAADVTLFGLDPRIIIGGSG